MISDLAILDNAKAHISDPAMWYRGGYSDGGLIGAAAGRPCCAFGAIVWASPWAIYGLKSANGAMALLERAIGGPIGAYNDAPHVTHADMMGMFDAAISAARR